MLDLPPEVLNEIVTYLFLPELQDFANSRLLFQKICSARLQRHKRLEAFASFCSEDSYIERWPKLPYWKTLLLRCLREPETIHYVRSLHGPDLGNRSTDIEPTFYIQDEPYFTHDEKTLVETALKRSPWIQDDDDYSHLFEDKSLHGFNSQLVPQWKTLDVLGILLPMLYNLEYLRICWDLGDRQFDTRRDYISLVQVLSRIRDSVIEDYHTLPWPRFAKKSLIDSTAPVGFLQLIADIVHEHERA